MMIEQISLFEHWERPKKIRSIFRYQCSTKEAEALIGKDLSRNKDRKGDPTLEGYYMAQFLGKSHGKRIWRIWWVSEYFELAA
jgi:hypothetical protein